MKDTNKFYYCHKAITTSGTIVTLYKDYLCLGIAVGGYEIDIQGNIINVWGVSKEEK